MPETDWEERLARLWASFDDLPDDEFRAAMQALVAELPDLDPVGLFEHASALDSIGQPDLAVGPYRQSLERGLSGPRRRQAVVQLASSLRNLGSADESVALLTAELNAASDDLDDAVRASWPSPSPMSVGNAKLCLWPFWRWLRTSRATDGP